MDPDVQLVLTIAAMVGGSIVMLILYSKRVSFLKQAIVMTLTFITILALWFMVKRITS